MKCSQSVAKALELVGPKLRLERTAKGARSNRHVGIDPIAIPVIARFGMEATPRTHRKPIAFGTAQLKGYGVHGPHAKAERWASPNAERVRARAV